MYSSSLILEGGGLRGIYTSGVLDFFMDQNIDFSCVVGSSAGACNGCRYVCHDRGAMHKIDTEYVFDKRYKGLKYMLTGHGYVNMDFLFDTIPEELYPFPWEEYFLNPCKFYSTVTNMITGNCEYLEKGDYKNCDPVRASSSLPIVAKKVTIGNNHYMDGGIANPIPYQKGFAENNNCVIVLTRPRGYQKKKDKSIPLVKKVYKNYPGLIKALEQRHVVYNKQLREIEDMVDNGTAFVIQPSKTIHIGRLSAKKEDLEAQYQLGYNDAKAVHQQLIAFLEEHK